jgi:hypothetical protein
VHVPEARVVTPAVDVPPVSVDDPTEQTDVVRLENETVTPLAEVVAEIETVFVGWNVWFVGAPKVMVWLALATENEYETVGAAFHEVLPAWFAATEHVPTATKLSVAPLDELFNEHTEEVLVESVTGRPDVAVAVSVIEVSTVRVPGLANEMVWLLFGTDPRHELEIRVHDDPTEDAR